MIHGISRKNYKKFKNLPIGSAESCSWWNVKELCIDATFFLLIRLSNGFFTKNFRPEIKCRIPYYLYGWIVPWNHARKHDESIFRRGASFSQFFSYENFVKKIALKLLIKWTSNVFIKEKSRKVVSPPQYWFVMLYNMISWKYSPLPIIWDAAFYLMSKIFGKNQFESRIKRKNAASIHNSFTFHQDADWQTLN